MAMKKRYKSRTKILSGKTGMEPGSLVYTGTRNAEKTVVNLIRYRSGAFSEEEVTELTGSNFPEGGGGVTWIDIKALNDLQLIEESGKLFGIHPLVQEDILNTNQRPKIEFFENHLFIVLKMLSYNEAENLIEAEQISLVVGKDYVITYQENYDDIFNNLRDSLRKEKGQVRLQGADYLAYSLMDTIVDHYYIILERIGQQIEKYEEMLLNNPCQEILNEIYILKRENLTLRKSVWPLREVVAKMERADSVLIGRQTLPFIRDLQDHTTIVIETVESYMEMISNLIELYLSIGNNRLNEVMKILTIISTIFIPLTFIAGIYGMNFRHMPELEWRWGYFAVLGVMALLGVLMVWFFRRKKWM